MIMMKVMMMITIIIKKIMMMVMVAVCFLLRNRKLFSEAGARVTPSSKQRYCSNDYNALILLQLLPNFLQYKQHYSPFYSTMI